MTASLRVTCSTGYHSLSKRDWRQWKRYGGKHLATMLNQDFKEFAGLLTSNRVDYLIVGGYALAAFGHPRYTGDLDFWTGTDPGNAQRLLNALKEFGFGALGIGLDDLTQPNRVIQLGYPPRRIDLLTSIDGVDFAVCHARRLVIAIDGLNLHFISLEDFKTNKRATGRHKDLADLEMLDDGSPDQT